MKQVSEQLVNKALTGGDSAAFSEIYFALRDSIFRFAYRMLGEASAAEDITHDVFIFLIENPQKYRAERGTLLAFLCGVARNQIMHRLRKRQSQSEIYREDFNDFVELKGENIYDPLNSLLAEELAEILEAETSKLSPILREVILLREMQELSYAEIAEITGAEIGAVKLRLHRARKILADRLASYFNKQSKEKKYEVCGS